MIQKIDFSILDWIQLHLKCPVLDWIMPKITVLGSLGALWVILAILFLFFKKYRKCGITMIAGMITGVLVGNVFLKNVIKRARPCWINTDIVLLVSNPTDYSFPSGHTLASFIAATVIFRFDRKIGVIAYVLAALISFSRLYLYVHFPTDVLAGMILGIGIGILVSFLLNKIFSKKQKKSE